MDAERTISKGRLTGILLALFGGALLMGATVAPHIFNFLLYLGRTFPALDGLRDVEFEKLAGRCALIGVLVASFPALRYSRMKGATEYGFKRHAGHARLVLSGWLIGMLSMIAMLAIGVMMGAYIPEWDKVDLSIIGKVLGYLVGAVLVGYIEEFFFRGAIFGMMRKGMGVFAGAMLASLIFAAVHFAAPEPPVGVVVGRWYSGFRMLPYMISLVDMRWSFGFMFLSLFVMGLTLCVFYDYFGHLYFCIGLHAGWVWVMRVGSYFIERDRTQYTMLYGPSMSVAKSGMALLVLLSFLVAALFLWIRRKRFKARSDVA